MKNVKNDPSPPSVRRWAGSGGGWGWPRHAAPIPRQRRRLLRPPLSTRPPSSLRPAGLHQPTRSAPLFPPPTGVRVKENGDRPALAVPPLYPPQALGGGRCLPSSSAGQPGPQAGRPPPPESRTRGPGWRRGRAGRRGLREGSAVAGRPRRGRARGQRANSLAGPFD